MTSKLKECNHKKPDNKVFVRDIPRGSLFYTESKDCILMKSTGMNAVYVYAKTPYEYMVGDSNTYSTDERRELVEPGKCVELFNE